MELDFSGLQNLIEQTQDVSSMPKEEWRDRYRQYLKSSQWKEIRQTRIREDGAKCRMCGGSINLQVHHTSYEDFNKFGCDKDTNHLVTLCQRCHRDVHNFPKDIRWVCESVQKPNCGSWYEKDRLEREERRRRMTFVTDIYVMSKCKEFYIDGDAYMMTNGSIGQLNTYLNCLFGFDLPINILGAKYQTVADFWEDKTGDKYYYAGSVPRPCQYLQYDKYRRLLKRHTEGMLLQEIATDNFDTRFAFTLNAQDQGGDANDISR